MFGTDFFRQIIDVPHRSVGAADASGAPVFASRGLLALCGVARLDEIRHLGLEALYPERLRARAREEAIPAVNAVGTWLGEIEDRLPDGTGRLYLSRWCTLGAGPHEGVRVHELVDVTGIEDRARRRMERERIESLGVLAGGIAHDFNNLLVGIMGNAELALLDLAAEAPARDRIQSIEEAAKRAAELSLQMLAYSGRGRFRVERIDLGRLVEEMAHILGAAVPANVRLEYELSSSTPRLDADAAQLRQAIQNLVGNAVDAIGDGPGTVKIRTDVTECDRERLSHAYLCQDALPGTYALVEVSDDGPGIAAETLPHIFDPFFTTKFVGRGLGLPVVLGVARGHLGAVDVHSAVDRGSTFRILLPLTAAGTADVGERPSHKPVDLEARGAALLADDDDMVRQVCARMLERLGFQAICARSAREAIDRVAEEGKGMAIAVVDLSMPGSDGVQCLEEIKRLRPELPVLLASGYAEDDLAARFADLGFAGFIQKPYRFRTLAQKINAALRRGDGAA
jgi:two-component system, cell cycle sensor histidine kinase and response regulator CckA